MSGQADYSLRHRRTTASRTGAGGLGPLASQSSASSATSRNLSASAPSAEPESSQLLVGLRPAAASTGTAAPAVAADARTSLQRESSSLAADAAMRRRASSPTADGILPRVCVSRYEYR